MVTYRRNRRRGNSPSRPSPKNTSERLPARVIRETPAAASKWVSSSRREDEHISPAVCSTPWLRRRAENSRWRGRAFTRQLPNMGESSNSSPLTYSQAAAGGGEIGKRGVGENLLQFPIQTAQSDFRRLTHRDKWIFLCSLFQKGEELPAKAGELLLFFCVQEDSLTGAAQKLPGREDMLG